MAGDGASEARTDKGSARTAPKELGGFEILSKIGQGGMGAVYKARQKSLDRIVALKVLPPSIAKNAQFIERFQREARASAKVSHANVVQGIDVGCDKTTGLWYFAMEFIDGPTLREIQREKRVIPERQALEIARDVAKALEAVAAAGMVHRDIKPDNILIASNGQVKLADLGLATQVSADDAGLTQSGQTVGTPFYMAPEQVRGLREKIDIRSDIYALGSTLFHLVTGKPPFTGNSSAEIMSKHLTENPPKPSDVNPDVSQACSKLILKLMSKKPEQRFQSPKELLDGIERILNAETQTGPRMAVRTTGPRAAVTTGPRAAVGTTGPRTAVSGAQRSADFKPRSKHGTHTAFLSIGVLAAILGVMALWAFGGASPAPQKTVQANPTADKHPEATPEAPKPAEPAAPVAKPAPAAVPTVTPAETKNDPPEAAKPAPAQPADPAAAKTDAPAPVTPAAAPADPAQTPPATPKEAPKPLPEAAADASSAAYDKFLDGFMTLLAAGNRKGAASMLAKADTTPELAALKPRLKNCELTLAWLADLDRFAQAGVLKIQPNEGFELRAAVGEGWKIGGKDGFAIESAKEGMIGLTQQGVSIPIALGMLHPATYRTLAERGMEKDAGALQLAFLDLLELRRTKSAERSALANVEAAIEKAKLAGALEEQVQFLKDIFAASEKSAAEAFAQAKWAELQKLTSKPGKALLPKLDEFEAQCLATEFGKSKADEIAQLRRTILCAEMVMNGLVVWLRADAGVNANNRHVRTWEDQSGKDHHAVQHAENEQPLVVPDGFNGKPSLHFDGVASNLTIKDVGPFQSFTLLFTLKPVNTENLNQALGSPAGYGQFAFHTTKDGIIFVGTTVKSRLGPPELKPGTLEKDVWQQFTYIFEPAKASLYKNGKLLASRKLLPESFTAFQIGYATKNTINGDISELAIYDRALPDAERQAVEKRMLGDNVVMQNKK